MAGLIRVFLYHVICHVITSTADPFYCDSQYGFRSLYSYAYTCDNIYQCIDRSDERGCVRCNSEKLLLSGLSPKSSLFVYETVFVKQSYRLRNREVYKSEGIVSAYIAYNDSSHRWIISKQADTLPILQSSVTHLSVPYLSHLQWSLSEEEEILSDVKLQCVPKEVNKCYGNLLLVTPDKAIILSKSARTFNSRHVYSNDKYTLQHVTMSSDWAAPHWQVIDAKSKAEVVVFISTAIKPEFITSPGLYNTTGNGWLKSSNVYVKCESLSRQTLQTDSVNPIDCSFQDGICTWREYSLNDFHMNVGSAELFSIGTKRDSSLYVIADQYVKSGKYRLTSADFNIETESCMVMSIANTVSVTDKQHLEITRNDLQSSEVIWNLDDCTDKGTSQRPCTNLNYITTKIKLSAGSDVHIEIDVELGKNQQKTGIISIKELSVISKSCDAVSSDDMDPCLDWPCNAGDCVRSGLRTFQCDCGRASPATGSTCSEEYTCPHDLPVPEDASVFKPHDTYIDVRCKEGFTLDSAIPVCLSDGSWSHTARCIPVTCPKILVTNGTVTHSDTSVQISCDKGFKLSSPETLLCTAAGTWNVPEIPECLKDCSYTDKEKIQLSDDVWVTLQICDFAKDEVIQNFTNCKTTNYTVADSGYAELRPDIHAEIDYQNQRTCVRYAELNSCQEECSNSVLVEIVRTAGAGDMLQSIQVISNVDWTDRLVNKSVPGATLSRTILLSQFVFLYSYFF